MKIGLLIIILAVAVVLNLNAQDSESKNKAQPGDFTFQIRGGWNLPLQGLMRDLGRHGGPAAFLTGYLSIDGVTNIGLSAGLLSIYLSPDLYSIIPLHLNLMWSTEIARPFIGLGATFGYGNSPIFDFSTGVDFVIKITENIDVLPGILLNFPLSISSGDMILTFPTTINFLNIVPSISVSFHQ